LINKKVDCPEGKALLIRRSFSDFNRLTNHFKPFESAVTSISTSAIVGQGTIQPNVFIKSSGNWRKLFDSPNVAIYDNTIIGNNVVIHAGTVLGADFITKRDAGFDKLLSGGVVIKIMLILEHCVRSIKELQETQL
jgi:UDP-3-O-[3-hydroxymyristoyl] glucosamine N-acyltransferase